MPFDPAQVYQPEADAFLLLKAAQAEVRAGDRVLEIGTGSGAVAAGLPGQSVEQYFPGNGTGNQTGKSLPNSE